MYHYHRDQPPTSKRDEKRMTHANSAATVQIVPYPPQTEQASPRNPLNEEQEKKKRRSKHTRGMTDKMTQREKFEKKCYQTEVAFKELKQ